MQLIRTGRNRWVILTRTLAIKFPSPRSWRDFLFGLLNNMNEKQWSGQPGACPVVWALPGGLFNIMLRAQEISAEEFASLDISFFEQNGLRVEHKRDSFGKLGDTIVAIDYGW